MTSYTGQVYPSSSPLGLGEVTTLTITSGAILPGATEIIQLPSPQSYQLNSISTSSPCWVRVYGTSYALFTDDRVNPGAPFPDPGKGFFAEIETVANNLVTSFSPPAEVQIDGTSTLLSVKNTSGSEQEITLTFDIVVSSYPIVPSSPPYYCNTSVDTLNQTDLSEAWKNCDLITQLPQFNLNSSTNLESAWENCTRLQYVPPGLFDNCPATNLTNAFVNCSLSAASVDNILVSLDEAGYENGTVDITGGNNSPPTVEGLAAKTNLEAKGWTVSVSEGAVVSFVDVGEDVYSLASFGDGRVFAGTYDGNVFKSTDFGENFDAGTLVGNDIIYSLAACDDQTVIAGTWFDSYYFVTTDNGANWAAGEDFNRDEIDVVSYAGDGTVYIGTKGYIQKSQDNGLTWTELPSPYTNDYYISIAYPGANKIVVGAWGFSYISFSSDGGLTWNTTGDYVLDGVDSPIIGLASDGNDTVIASMEDDGRVFRSLNAGATWDTGYQLGSATAVRCLTCSETGVFYAGTNDDGKIYRSLDNGETWEEFYNPEIPGGYVYSLVIGGNNSIFAGIDTFVYAIPYNITSGSSSIPVTQLYPVSNVNKNGLVKSDPTGVGGASNIVNMISISQADYDNLAEKDPKTLYIIPN